MSKLEWVEQAIKSNLREIRIYKGLTQEEVSKLSGISVTTFSHYESMKSPRIPSVRNLVRICVALNVSSDHILGLNNE